MSSIVTELDHLVIAARTLSEGRIWARDVLGAAPDGGGRHDGLATHNALLKLDGRRYLEIIAIDPDAGAPQFPRWFGLDNEEVRARIAHGPRLVAWVARCSGTADAIEQLSATPGYAASVVRSASRADFRWRFAFTPDGRPPAGGTLPHLIQWDVTAHPSDGLPDRGVALTALMLGQPEPERLQGMLDALHLADATVQAGQSAANHLVAILRTPHGGVVLD